MDARTGKRIAQEHKLELYYDTQWKLWGLIDPSCMSSEESQWIATATLKRMTIDEFRLLCEGEVRKHQIVLTD